MAEPARHYTIATLAERWAVGIIMLFVTIVVGPPYRRA